MCSRPRLHACPLLAKGEKSSGPLRRVENCEKLVPKTSEKIENENAAAPTESVLEEASGWICSIQRLQEPALPEATPGSPAAEQPNRERRGPANLPGKKKREAPLQIEAKMIG